MILSLSRVTTCSITQDTHSHTNLAMHPATTAPTPPQPRLPPHHPQRPCQRRHARRAAVAPGARDSSNQQLVLDPASLLPLHVLKEWAVLCAALGQGKQTVLFRKGGVRETAFTPQAGTFLMFPTAFHSNMQLLKPGLAEQFADEMKLQPREVQRLPLRVLVMLTGAWTTSDPQVLRLLDSLHVCSDGFLDARLKWRGSEPLTLLECRAYLLSEPVVFEPAARPEYFGCFSWVQLQDADVLSGSGAAPRSWALTPALSDGEFARRQEILRAELDLVNAQHLPLPF